MRSCSTPAEVAGPLLLCLLFSDPLLAAAPKAHWLREPALSPDGASIAFRSDGDLYIADVKTGQARLLRGTPAHESNPVWLSDGRRIAFASDTFGSYDVFIMPADGGEPTRLSWHSRDEFPVGASPDGKSLLIRTARLDVGASRAAYPMVMDEGEDFSQSTPWTGIFSLPVEGGMPRPLVEPNSLEAAWDSSGEQLAFSVRPGSEVVFRKHERSPATSDLWLRERGGTTFRRLTSFDGLDTTPVWNPQDGLLYFLSERSGSLNVWRMSPEGDASAVRVTHHDRHPVRGLTVSAKGLLAYGYRGELYVGTLASGFQKLSIKLAQRPALPAGGPSDLSSAIRVAALVPNREEVVVVAQGEAYSLEPSSQRRRTLFVGYPGAKSWPTLSADGRSLLVVRDRGNSSDLLLTELATSSHSWVDASAVPRVKTLAETRSETILRAALSADGTQAAFTTGMTLRVVSARDGKVRDLVTRAQGLETADQEFAWHPAGAYLALQWRMLHRNTTEIAVISVADGSIFNLTQSGFNDTAPSWARDGRVLLWNSDREGLRNFGQEGGTVEPHGLFLDPAAQRAYASKHTLTGEKPASTDEVKEWLRQLRDDPSLIAERRLRLAEMPARSEVAVLAPSGRFQLRVQKADEANEVWSKPLGTPDDARGQYRLGRLASPSKPGRGFGSINSIQISADERKAVILLDGAAHWIDLASGAATALELKDVAPVDASVEQRWAFEHVVRAVNRVYYRPGHLVEIDWPGYVSDYRRWLSAVHDPNDFAELMSELLGELDASHTQFNYERTSPVKPSGSLGVFYDPDYQGPGWRIAEVLRTSPLGTADESARAGDIITSINGVTLPTGSDPARYLLDVIDKPVDLALTSVSGTSRQVRVTPVSTAQESSLAYRRWVDWQQRETQRQSGGRLGYVHMPQMDEGAFRSVIEDALGRYVGASGIIFDTRFNQGGWMHEPVLSFLSSPYAFDLRSNGTIYASEPAWRVGRPFVVLINQANYSNGSETPRLLHERGLGKLIGEPYAGTGLGSHDDPLPYWRYSYGVAYDVCLTPDGKYWEGVSQEPDIRVAADRAALRVGRDVQLEAAVSALMEQLH